MPGRRLERRTNLELTAQSEHRSIVALVQTPVRVHNAGSRLYGVGYNAQTVDPAEDSKTPLAWDRTVEPLTGGFAVLESNIHSDRDPRRQQQTNQQPRSELRIDPSRVLLARLPLQFTAQIPRRACRPLVARNPCT